MPEHINSIYEQIPIYESRQVHRQLLEDGYAGVNTVSKYRKELGLRPVLAVKSANTSMPNKKHKKYSYNASLKNSRKTLAIIRSSYHNILVVCQMLTGC